VTPGKIPVHQENQQMMAIKIKVTDQSMENEVDPTVGNINQWT